MGGHRDDGRRTVGEMFVGVQFKLEGETRKYNVTASGTVPSDDAGSTTCTLPGDST